MTTTHLEDIEPDPVIAGQEIRVAYRVENTESSTLEDTLLIRFFDSESALLDSFQRPVRVAPNSSQAFRDTIGNSGDGAPGTGTLRFRLEGEADVRTYDIAIRQPQPTQPRRGQDQDLALRGCEQDADGRGQDNTAGSRGREQDADGRGSINTRE